MNRVTITIHVDLPEGLTPDVDYGTAPVVYDRDEVVNEPPGLFEEAERIFAAAMPDPDPDVREYQQKAAVMAAQPAVQVAMTPVCPVHQKQMTYFPAGITKSGPNAGKPRGAFYKCGVKDGDRWCTQRRDAAA